MVIQKLMVIIATTILIISLWLYHAHPGDDVVVTVIATCLGFLFGKATNGARRYKDGSKD